MNNWISAAAGLAGVMIGAGITQGVAYLERHKREKTFWAALRAEVEMCDTYAKTYIIGNVESPSYRMPIVAYSQGFTGLLAAGAVSQLEFAAVLGFYSIVEQFNRGADQAQASKYHERVDALMREEADRLFVKAKHLANVDADKPYKLVCAAIDKHL